MKKTIMLLAGLMVILAAAGFADAQDISIDVLDGAEQASPLNWRSDKLVWQTGTIDDINSSAMGVVINDMGYQWSKYGTRYRNLDGGILALSDFGQGTEVTFVLEGDRKTIVTLIKGSPIEDEEYQKYNQRKK